MYLLNNLILLFIKLSPIVRCYLYCQSNKFYCFAFWKNMVHGEARAECSCFNFFPFRFLHLHHFLFFSVLVYSLPYLIGKILQYFSRLSLIFTKLLFIFYYNSFYCKHYCSFVYSVRFYYYSFPE